MSGKFLKLSEVVTDIMHEKFSLNDSDKTSDIDYGSSGYTMKTGIASLDEMLDSFDKGHLYAIGGRPFMGKKTLLSQAAINIVSSTNKSAYIISLEMPAELVVLRMISQIIDIDQISLRTGKLSQNQKELICTCWAIMDAMPIYICDTSPLSMEEIDSLVKDEVLDGILMIDYIQLIDTYNKKTTAEIWHALKLLSVRQDIPVVVTTQLSRAVEYHAGQRPVLQDLGSACCIEQDIDGVIFIRSDAYYSNRHAFFSNNGGNDAELILAKNYRGPIGTAHVKFNRARLLFE